MLPGASKPWPKSGTLSPDAGTFDRGLSQVVDQSGNELAVNAYDEYGVPNSGNQGRFGYTGQAWLPELGMYYYKSRIYSPTLGRFLQTDPIGYGDGMNWYSYVGGGSGQFYGSARPCRRGLRVRGRRLPTDGGHGAPPARGR
jgi:RHS repeat-associated protein